MSDRAQHLGRRLEEHDGLAEIASPRPMGPTCSPVLALTFTAVSPTRSSRARLARMAGLWGPSLGSWAWMITSQLTARHPARSIRSTTSAKQPRAVQPLPLGIGVGIVLADIAQAGGPQERIGHGMTDHVGVGVTDQPARMLDLESAQDQWPPLDQSMGVVTDPNPHVHAPSPYSRHESRPHHPYKRPSRIVAFSRLPCLSRHVICARCSHLQRPVLSF